MPISSEEKILLQNLSSSISPLNDEELDSFAALFEPVSFKRKTILTRTGEKEKFLYVVKEGIQRIYFLSPDGKEADLIFTYAPSFGGVLDSMMLGSPSRYHYETLTQSEMLRAPMDAVLQLASKPGVAKLLQKGLAISLAGLLERLVETQSGSSEEKFRALLRRSPHILHTVPHKYLASYLGIDPTNFSKLLHTIPI